MAASLFERGVTPPVEGIRPPVLPPMTPELFSAGVDKYVKKVVVGSPGVPEDGDFKRLEADALSGGGISEVRTHTYEIILGLDRLGSLARQLYNIRRENDAPLKGTSGELEAELKKDAQDSKDFVARYPVVISKELSRLLAA